MVITITNSITKLWDVLYSNSLMHMLICSSSNLVLINDILHSMGHDKSSETLKGNHLLEAWLALTCL